MFNLQSMHILFEQYLIPFSSDIPPRYELTRNYISPQVFPSGNCHPCMDDGEQKLRVRPYAVQLLTQRFRNTKNVSGDNSAGSPTLVG